MSLQFVAALLSGPCAVSLQRGRFWFFDNVSQPATACNIYLHISSMPTLLRLILQRVHSSTYSSIDSTLLFSADCSCRLFCTVSGPVQQGRHLHHRVLGRCSGAAAATHCDPAAAPSSGFPLVTASVSSYIEPAARRLTAGFRHIWGRGSCACTGANHAPGAVHSSAIAPPWSHAVGSAPSSCPGHARCVGGTRRCCRVRPCSLHRVYSADRGRAPLQLGRWWTCRVAF